ncbi:MAG: hypothetical protein ABEJ98_01540 [Candidatus Nanohaloarchaea archaeon]
MDVFGPVEVLTRDYQTFEVFYEEERVAAVELEDGDAVLRYLEEGFSNPDYEMFMEHAERGIDEMLEEDADYRLPEQLGDYSSTTERERVATL